MLTLPFAAAAVLLIAALLTDLRSMLIPNRLTVSFFAAGCLYQTISGGWSGLWTGLLGAVAGFVPLFILHLARGIGAGDVKLFAALGVWVGTSMVLQMMMYAILYAGLIGVLLVLFNRPFSRRMLSGLLLLLQRSTGPRRKELGGWAAGGTTFPFMLAVVPGAITAWLMIT
ncbi:hypothetical protein BBD42_16835 [Paenibacillus sp. BIHB 4019]|uniref:Prepilin type IV endopeptidase peptidase domain-containing protein n=1 Tax=Paenibacillus sp. BIHB 4019 TaxID=1870819 RepID=A0A1B2DJR7_9BACL|nr:A24 family peptidase [Paenibacillus sp. BIHB 4019]ANY67953.1 hypothetical protein BBD42_16835 [Paenibacillus sp. BIHB 4019]